MMNAFQRSLLAYCLLVSSRRRSGSPFAAEGFVVPRDLHHRSHRQQEYVPFLQRHQQQHRNLGVRHAKLVKELTADGDKQKKKKLEVVRRTDNPFAWRPLGAHENSYEVAVPSVVMASRSSRSPPGKSSSNQQQQQQADDGERIGELADFLQTKEGGGGPPSLPSLDSNKTTLAAGAAALVLTAGLGLAVAMGITPSDALDGIQAFFQNPQEALQGVTDGVQAMGPLGPLYFGLIYLVAEILAVPATPLTLSAGYLFGVGQGTAVVLVAATIAASVAFLVGKTLLRSWVEETLKDQPKFAKVDRAIGKEGFKLLLLVRLSPIFPFALSNYLYGASSIDFPSYFWGTLLGFAPGTFALVYTGMVGKALTLGGAGADQPWYVYAGGFAILATFLKLVTDVAGGIVDAIDDDEEEGADSGSVPPSVL